MTAIAALPMRVVLYEGEDSSALEAPRRADILRGLLTKGYAVTVARGNGAVAPADQSAMLVIGEFAEGQVPAATKSTDGTEVRFENINAVAAADVVGRVEQFRTERSGAPAHGAWKPWFPVIDYDRCTNCMQCLSFCLFDVYSVDENKRITVRNEDKCKTNCPACSRVCPDVAILFPKYRQGPINGDVVNAEDVEREKMKIDISALLGGDIYKMLRDRHARAQSRFSKERDESKALKERMRCLQQLQDQLDIPPEVLMALPSLDEIKFKADKAAKTAEEALRDGGPDASDSPIS